MTVKRFTYNVNKNCIECDGKFVAYLDGVDGFRIANKLTVLTKENEQLKQSYKEFEDECQSTFNAMSRKQNDLYRKNFKLKEENEQLKTQLYYDNEEGVCNICKHHYLVKDNEAELGYYNSRCKKGHYECAKVSLKHCKDFEKELEE